LSDGLDETQEILRDALNGDPRARNRLFERERARLMIWVRGQLSRKLRAKYEPDDVVQEVLLAAHRSLADLRTQTTAAFRSWLFRIARNRISDLADHVGAKKRQPILPVAPSQTTPGTLSMRAEEAQRAMDGMGRLTEIYRRVLLLRLIEDVPVAEIAETLERTPNAIRILVMRARQALGAELGGKP